MNILPRHKQVEVIAALCEGVSVRATERLSGVNRGTILSLGVRVGDGCAVLHDAMMRGLHVSRIELDEAWSFVAKKQRHLKPTDPRRLRRSICLPGARGRRQGDHLLPGRQAERRELPRFPR
jgi:hypothetical protein